MATCEDWELQETGYKIGTDSSLCSKEPDKLGFLMQPVLRTVDRVSNIGLTPTSPGSSQEADLDKTLDTRGFGPETEWHLRVNFHEWTFENSPWA